MNNKKRNSSKIKQNVEVMIKMLPVNNNCNHLDQNNYRIVQSHTIYHKIILNARGVKYEVYLNSFISYPNSRLGKLQTLLTRSYKQANHSELMQICDDYDMKKYEFYFNRDPNILNLILNLYTIDSTTNEQAKFHFGDNICYRYLFEQLFYWGFNHSEFPNLIDKCCLIQLEKERDLINQELEKERIVLNDLDFEYDFGTRFFPNLRRTLFNYMEKPDSFIGKAYLFTTCLFLSMSIFLIALNTIPSVDKDLIITYILGKSIIVWFTAEMIVRLFAYPSLLIFFSSALNIIEFISLSIYYVTMYMPRNELISYVRMFARIMRVFTYLRIGRHTTGLQTLSDTIKYSRKEMTFYLFYLFLGVLTFSNICYAFEFKTPDTKFTSIPATIWWSIITMTTVGFYYFMILYSKIYKWIYIFFKGRIRRRYANVRKLYQIIILKIFEFE
jgi:potassium voltage-gated channel Shal-related subfamily D protein 3